MHASTYVYFADSAFHGKGVQGSVFNTQTDVFITGLTVNVYNSYIELVYLAMKDVCWLHAIICVHKLKIT